VIQCAQVPLISGPLRISRIPGYPGRWLFGDAIPTDHKPLAATLLTFALKMIDSFYFLLATWNCLLVFRSEKQSRLVVLLPSYSTKATPTFALTGCGSNWASVQVCAYG